MLQLAAAPNKQHLVMDRARQTLQTSSIISPLYLGQ